MNIFDIIGPVMIGPSSSHTAGAVRLGRVVNKLIDDRKLKKVEITLSGSFAQTYRGHGTDRALLAGIMGYKSYSPEIRDAHKIAAERGIEYTFIKENIKGAHPNTARIHYFLEDGSEGVMQGASVGGGNILVKQINGMDVEFSGDNNTILVMHEDKPGVIASVTNMMHWEHEDLNISKFHLSRQEKGGEAIMTIEIDNKPPETLVDEIRGIDHVLNAILIKRV
ncbi:MULTISPECIES: L-serine ammonia-lyase, iron-sulfur-dependent subunit beta [unclassified Butyrivibrio]|uniref:L-serine ammonia-lyase, iron-sulfur-dependent subunit beta n=1 Tax=unclassified Butyrivibrio TaxID=2639466 RepID=UPI0003F58815|nr:MULTISPECIES: L-serine ammonia-lyase, iron-sulfur-dependent subunit beta [unclassified Butyrivibrio]SDB24651.1 L-serine dehydratase [Butyrivibrio sp. INlla16]SEL19836.1 L-serine dehydratase [Butyrivibrio sp. ob235]